MRLKQVVNLRDWQQRNIAVGYGTRDKIVLKQTPKGKVYFLAKTYDKDIGELRSEVCASNLGRLFGFSVQKTWLCKIPQYKTLKLSHRLGVLIQLDVRRQSDTRRNQFREDLIHGDAIISVVHKNFTSLKEGSERRNAYTLQAVVDGIRKYVADHKNSEALWEQFFELLAFDALIGGTDRHYNNWGILEKADTGEFIRLVPAFDNGASLMWKLEEYRPKFMKDLISKNFPRKAESMFKKTGGGKYSLFAAVEAFYTLGDFKGSDIAVRLLDRLESIRPSRIGSVLFNNIPQQKQFETQRANLGVICEYAKIRLSLLKETLSKLGS